MMKDPAGNPLPEGYGSSIEGQLLLLLDDIERALWTLAHADKNRRSKAQMHDDIREAERYLVNAKKRIKG